MPRSSSPARRRSGATPPPASGPLPCLVYVVLSQALGAGSLAYYHFERHGVVSPVQFALATFCVLNAWICVCELALMIHCAGIRKRYDANTKALGAGRLAALALGAGEKSRAVLPPAYARAMARPGAPSPHALALPPLPPPAPGGLKVLKGIWGLALVVQTGSPNRGVSFCGLHGPAACGLPPNLS